MLEWIAIGIAIVLVLSVVILIRTGDSCGERYEEGIHNIGFSVALTGHDKKNVNYDVHRLPDGFGMCPKPLFTLETTVNNTLRDRLTCCGQKTGKLKCW
jgi:hypothetical protein